MAYEPIRTSASQQILLRAYCVSSIVPILKNPALQKQIEHHGKFSELSAAENQQTCALLSWLHPYAMSHDVVSTMVLIE